MLPYSHLSAPQGRDTRVSPFVLPHTVALQTAFFTSSTSPRANRESLLWDTGGDRLGIEPMTSISGCQTYATMPPTLKVHQLQAAGPGGCHSTCLAPCPVNPRAPAEVASDPRGCSPTHTCQPPRRGTPGSHRLFSPRPLPSKRHYDFKYLPLGQTERAFFWGDRLGLEPTTSVSGCRTYATMLPTNEGIDLQSC